MRLKTVHITEYKNVIDSTPFEITDVTCLVGKNEAGKTALLKALYTLNPIVESEAAFDVVDDYPRRFVEDYQHEVETGERDPATVVRATFELDGDDLDDLYTDYGKKILKSPTLTLSRGVSSH